MTTFSIAWTMGRRGTLLGSLALVLISLWAPIARAQPTTTVDLIASTTTVAAGQTLSLAGIIRTTSPTPITLQLALDVTPGLTRAVLLKSVDGACTDATTSCVVSVAAATPAQVTITVVVRPDAPSGASITAVLEATGAGAPIQSAPVTIQVLTGAGPTAVASGTTAPTATAPVSSAPGVTAAPPVSNPTATTTPVPSATLARTASPTADMQTLPDHCEPNDTPDRACAIPIDAISGPFTLVPEDDSDYYQLDLGQPSGQPTGQPTTLFVRAPAELALITSVLAGPDHHQIALIADGAISTTLARDVSGLVLLHVESRATVPTSGASYRLEARRAVGLPPTPTPLALGASVPPDALENNWTGDAAPVVGLDVAYDLNFTCPVSWGCVGGDHDYVKVPVKRGIDYLIATFDLGPGVDTAIDLFWNDEQHPLGGNDDAAAGKSLLSVIRWRAPNDGIALIRIAPRTGKNTPLVMDSKAGTYRFAVALKNGAFGQELEQRIAAQTLAPPTATPRSPQVSSAGGTSSGPAAQPAAPLAQPSVVASTIASGPAQLIRDTPVYLGPSATSAPMATVQADTVITLTGQTSNLWVQITSDQFVLPGWVPATAVQRLTHAAAPLIATTTPPTPTTSGLAGTALPLATTVLPEAPGAGAPVLVDPLPPAPVPPTPVAARTPLALTVVVQAASGTVSSGPVPTASRDAGLDGVRVQLVNALGDVLAEGLTRDGGRIALACDLPASTNVWVRLPVLGMSTALAVPRPATLVIAVPVLRAGGAS